jgi:hypothetical protein
MNGHYVVPAGVVVSIGEIKSTVAEVLKENMEAITEQRYHINGLCFSFRFLLINCLCS